MAGVLHWEINPPHLWAGITPPLHRTNGLASLVSSILDSYHPSPELGWCCLHYTTVFEHLARLSPEPCSGLCKQSYQTNTINNNLSWVGFYGSRYPGSLGSIERGREVAARDRARNWCLVITFYRQNNSDIDHNSGGEYTFMTRGLYSPR